MIEINGPTTGTAHHHESMGSESLISGYAATRLRGYDPLSRLLSVTATGANQSFAWDANGNRTSHTWGGATDGYSTATANNRLSAITGPRATSYSYDNAGNTLTGEGAARNGVGVTSPVAIGRPTRQHPLRL